MVVRLERDITESDIQAIMEELKKYGIRPDFYSGAEEDVILMIGDERKVDIGRIEAMKGVKEVKLISDPFKLISRDYHPEDTVIDVDGIRIGGDGIVIIAGPCSVEGREQLYRTAEEVKKAGAHILRGGAIKLRSEDGTFEGLGEKALEYLARAKEDFEMPIIVEIVDPQHVKLYEDYGVDILQIGMRVADNSYFLNQIAEKTKKPILYKRGESMDLDRWLKQAERIYRRNNSRENGNGSGLMLCLRGIKSGMEMEGKYMRNTPDLIDIPVLKKRIHLPVIFDPSHATGKSELVPYACRMALVGGVDGLLIEVHYNPAEALSDGPQSITPDVFRGIMDDIGSYSSRPLYTGKFQL